MAKMKIVLSFIICAVSVSADFKEDRANKLPYIADAVGHSIPRPPNGPAEVGSPVNLLTPDRYEFYTFDESGELVKRLMTLEEIQAIVAAGEDAEGLVTFANENQPTIAFNFSQPPYTKVNSVVNQVQNVLKAEIEAHKNNPHKQPTLDTPDVSDSWSLILPSIFGNTGIDIVPDKTSGSFITPETDTLEDDNMDYVYFSKTNSAPVVSSPRPIDASSKLSTVLEAKYPKTTPLPITYVTKTSTELQRKPVTLTTSTTPQATTDKERITSTTSKPITSSPTTTRHHSSSTPNIQKINTKPVKVTTKSPSTKKDFNGQNSVTINTESHINSHLTTGKIVQETTEKMQNVFVPVSTIPHSTQITTEQSNQSTKIASTSVPELNLVTHTLINEVFEKNNELQQIPLSESPLLIKDDENYKVNLTTLTTQSVSLSTVPSSTEVIDKYSQASDNDLTKDTNLLNTEEPVLPIFDFAQSISQIASDLGGNYAPVATTSFVDNTNENKVTVESKENIDIDIPQEVEKVTEKQENVTENYIKITLDVDPENETDIEQSNNSRNETSEDITLIPEVDKIETTTIADSIETTTMDFVLADSMEDLLSQVVYQTSNIVSSRENVTNNDNKSVNTEESYNNTSEILANPTEIPLEISTSSITLNLSKNIDQPLISEEQSTTQGPELLITTERSYKNDDGLEFVPISSSRNVSISELLKHEEDKVETVNTSTENVIQSNNLNENINQSTQNNKFNKEKVETTTLLNQIETTTNLIKEFNSAPKENKLNSIDKIKVQNKIYVDLPKVEEFKKKIQKINIDDKELDNERNSSWKLIPTVPPPKVQSDSHKKYKPEGFYTHESNSNKHISLDVSTENQGLEETSKDLGEDIAQFVALCNELAFQYWDDLTEGIDKKRSFVLSPYAVTSMLAMVFMGARGATSGEMNDVLKLDDMVTFNPHFTLRNISDSIDISPASGVAISAFIKELYSDRSKGKILTFYKERAQKFYNGHVEEINFKLISDVIRRRTNLLVKRFTMGKITEYMKTNSIVMQPPLAAFSMNIFKTDCTGSSVDGRDGEMYFVVSPNVRQRRLVPVPAVVYRADFLAGYDPVLDATAAALGNADSIISTLFLMPGQQGNIVHGEDLETLEKRFLASNAAMSWNRLLRTLLPRVGLELQIPRFSHKSIFNVSSTLRKMGLKELFDHKHADLGGLNGPSKNLYLSDMVQQNTFVTCGEGMISEQHHIEEYPETLDMEKVQRRRSARWLNWDEPRDYQRAFHDPHDGGDAMHLPLHLRPRQARLPARSQPARLKFDRPFLFFVRHNLSGMILYVGRYNPRLLP